MLIVPVMRLFQGLFLVRCPIFGKGREEEREEPLALYGLQAAASTKQTRRRGLTSKPLPFVLTVVRTKRNIGRFSVKPG